MIIKPKNFPWDFVPKEVERMYVLSLFYVVDDERNELGEHLAASENLDELHEFIRENCPEYKRVDEESETYIHYWPSYYTEGVELGIYLLERQN